MYNIDILPQKQLIDIRMSGFFSVADAKRFCEDEQRAVAQMGALAGNHLVLVDVTAMKIQSQEVVYSFQELIDNAPRKARRIALVVGKSLSMMQARRLDNDAGRLGLFDYRSDAMDWLLERPSHPPMPAHQSASPFF